MADETLAQQLSTLRSLLDDVDARLTRAPALPAGLEDLKRSVDTLRTNSGPSSPRGRARRHRFESNVSSSAARSRA